MNKKLHFQELGLKDYKETWDLQEDLFQEILDTKIKNRREETSIDTQNHFLFVEHPHVYTLGKNGDIKNLLLSEDQLKEKKQVSIRSIAVATLLIMVTGQIIGYPILDLENFFRDIHRYLRTLEEVIILTLKDYGLKPGKKQR